MCVDRCAVFGAGDDTHRPLPSSSGSLFDLELDAHHPPIASMVVNMLLSAK